MRQTDSGDVSLGAMDDDGRKDVTDDAVEAANDPRWAPFALGALRLCAQTYHELTTDDVWATLDEIPVPRPREPRAMGAIIREGVAREWIVYTDRVMQSRRDKTADGKVHHTTKIAVYESLLCR